MGDSDGGEKMIRVVQTVHRCHKDGRRTRLFSAAMIAAAICLSTTSAQAAPGDLDSIFGTGGKVITDFGSSAAAIAIQGDGKIVAVGDSGSGDFALARYKLDGSLDTSFDGDGKVTTDLGVFDEASDVAIHTDGKIVAAGTTCPNGFCFDLALARYNPDGSLDASFDGDGKLILNLDAGDVLSAVAIQADGKIVAAGAMFSPFGGSVALLRFNSDGSLDPGFDGDGIATTDFGGSGGVSDVKILPNGKIVVGGAGGPSSDFAVARFNADGSLDTSFGSGGKVTTDFGGFDGTSAVAIQIDGKLVAAGVGGFFSRFAVARYNADGSLDASFDGDGKVITEFFGENIDSANGVAIQENGKIVAAGRAFSQFDSSYALARYHTDGSLDASFGIDGKVTTDFGNPSDVGVLCPPARKDCSEDIANDVAIQQDGRIIAVGGGGACIPPCQWTLARYLGDPTVPTCNGKPATIVGPAGDSTVTGTPGADVIVDLTGNNKIRGFGGNDTICSGPGTDQISGGGGNDWVDAGDGTNSAEGNAGHDTIITGSGSDELEGNGGNDTLTGGAGADKFRGGDGTDTATDFLPAEGDTKVSVEVAL